MEGNILRYTGHKRKVDQMDIFGQNIYKEVKLQDVLSRSKRLHLTEKLVNQEICNSKQLQEVAETDKIHKVPSLPKKI